MTEALESELAILREQVDDYPAAKVGKVTRRNGTN
jgi:hypothetical protein